MTDDELRFQKSSPVKPTKVIEKPLPLKQPKRMIVFDNYHVIGTVPTGDKRQMQVSIGIRDGVVMIALRDFFFSVSRNVWIPGYNGLTVPVRIPINRGTEIIEPYLSLVDLMNTAVEISKTLPISDPEHTLYAK